MLRSSSIVVRRRGRPSSATRASDPTARTVTRSKVARRISVYLSAELVGASPFPRHWLYDDSGKLVEKSGTIDFKTWFNDSFGKHTPWGDQDSDVLTVEAESEIERALRSQRHRRPAPRSRVCA